MGNTILTYPKIQMSKKGGKAPATSGFNAAQYVGNGVFEDEVNELKEAFDTFDADLSGMISVQELVSCFKKLGFGEFFALMTMKFSKDTPREDIEKVFKQFDAD